MLRHRLCIVVLATSMLVPATVFAEEEEEVTVYELILRPTIEETLERAKALELAASRIDSILQQVQELHELLERVDPKWRSARADFGQRVQQRVRELIQALESCGRAEKEAESGVPDETRP